MSNISLIKVTSFVCVLASFSFLVSATNQNSMASELQNSAKKMQFSELIRRYDNNKDGLLNQSEVSKSNNSFLKSAFSAIDQDNNLAISKAEFTTYIAKNR